MQREFNVKFIVEGECEGEVTVIEEPVSPLGEINASEGTVRKGSREYFIKDKILVYPYTIGSTVGSYVIYSLKYYGKNPKAIVVLKPDPILIAGCVLADIPLAQVYSEDFIRIAKQYRHAKLECKGVYGRIILW